MTRTLTCLFLLALTAAPALADGPTDTSTPPILDTETMDAAMAQRAADEEAARARIVDLLRHEDVRAVADEVGIDLARAESAVGTLTGADLQRVDQQARSVDKALSGGDVVISRFAIIIALLVLIILLVA